MNWQEIHAGIIGNEPEAWLALYTELRSGTVAALIRRGSRPQQATDRAHDVFLAVFASKSLASIADLRRFVVGIIIHKRNDALRDEMSERGEELEHPPVAPNQLERLLADERRQQLAVVMKDLPPAEREILSLRFEGLDQKQIVQRTGLRSTLVANRSSRGQQRLTSALREQPKAA